MTFDTLQALLVWVIAGGGAIILANAVITLLFENWVWWHTAPDWFKKAVPIIFAGAFGIAAQLALSFDLGGLIPEPFATILLIFLGYLIQQITLAKADSAGYASSAKARAVSGDG